jgi:hypothetical protein
VRAVLPISRLPRMARASTMLATLVTAAASGLPIRRRVSNCKQPAPRVCTFRRGWDRPSSVVVCHAPVDTRRFGCGSPGWGGGSPVLPTPRMCNAHHHATAERENHSDGSSAGW